MNQTAFKYIPIFACAVFTLLSANAVASDYVYRDLLGNTLRPDRCSARGEAEQRAVDPYQVGKFIKRFCETQGYGWYLAEQKGAGKLVCESCSGSEASETFKCHVEDIAVACKRLKPGTAGLVPGKS